MLVFYGMVVLFSLKGPSCFEVCEPFGSISLYHGRLVLQGRCRYDSPHNKTTVGCPGRVTLESRERLS